VSAWEFEPELEIANCFVEARTEIEFFDSECTVMSNLPVPKQNEVYYWEAKIYEKPENTLLSIGMATKPYPLFRLPGKTRNFCRINYKSKTKLTKNLRIPQVFGSISFQRHAQIQSAILRNAIRAADCSRRCRRRRLPTSNWNHLLYT